MKRSAYISTIAVITGLMAFSSCRKDFLNKTPYDAVPFDEAIQTESDLDAAVNGVYSAMRVSTLYGRTVPIMGDLLADNVYIFEVNSNRYIPFNTYAIFDDNGDVDGIWSTAFNAILRANQAINADVPASDNVNQLRGEAYAARACVYFDLVHVFGLPYSPDHLNAPAVPLVLAYDQELKPQRNTVGEVYTQIVADLNAAIGLLNEEKNSEYIDIWVAKGLLAKVYQYMGDWANAKTYAEDVILNGGYVLSDSADYLSYWANPGATVKSETLFELSLDAAQNNGFDALDHFYAESGYGDALCDSNLYNLYASGDVRKQLILPDVRGGQPILWVNKFPNATLGTDDDDMKILRLSEVYLILAEADYQLGDEGNARTYLNTIAEQREPSFTGYTETGTALLDAITQERRKELAFEGNRVFDLNRLGLDIHRGLQYPPDALDIPINDHRRIMPIPLNEMNANTNMTQNPEY